MNWSKMTSDEKANWLCQHEKEVFEARKAFDRFARIAGKWLQRIHDLAAYDRLLTELKNEFVE